MLVRLPCGYFDGEGLRHRDVEIAALSGREEELLADLSAPPAALVTDLLAAVARGVGTHPMTTDLARELTVGDRLFLLLKLRELTIGPRVQAVVSCPWHGCSSRIDVDFLLSDVPVREIDDGPVFEVELSPESAIAGERVIRFRLPTGADQEAVAPLIAGNPAAALACLLDRCVLTVDDVGSITPRARAEIEEAMAAAAPGPHLRLEADCPECARGFSLPFDIQELFFGELHASNDLLFREVHYLAYHYHWGEAEILDMSRDRRRRYIDVLAEEIERLNDAVV